MLGTSTKRVDQMLYYLHYFQPSTNCICNLVKWLVWPINLAVLASHVQEQRKQSLPDCSFSRISRVIHIAMDTLGGGAKMAVA